jgi:predicted ABC-type ATPase
VSQQGHDVPREKIISRYERSLDLLLRAIRATDRAYLFDNSSQAFERSWFAEVAEGTHFKLRTDTVPAWFMTNVIEKASNK